MMNPNESPFAGILMGAGNARVEARDAWNAVDAAQGRIVRDAGVEEARLTIARMHERRFFDLAAAAEGI